MRTHYDILTRVLHWIMATVIIYAMCAGYIMHLVIDSSPHIFNFLSVLNMSLATVGSALFIIRFIWSFLRPTISGIQPSGIQPSGSLQTKIAHVAHSLLYILMFTVFVSGFLMLKTGYDLFWLIPIDNLISDPEVNAFFFMMHRVSCAMLALLVAVHASAALHHHYKKKNNVLHSMVGPALKAR
ncbi:cytochrome b [Photobacterium indicum]|uniref:cytochrome b n=1 Tax=Photobacterium indicum TaxID=81447 RepID=UPI003D122155